MFEVTPASKEHQFGSAKTRGQVPVRHEIIHHALVQASLDPSVRTIEHLPTAPYAAATVAVDAILLATDRGRFALDVIELRPLRDIDAEGLTLLALQELSAVPLTLSAADIRTEPRFSNCRIAWSYRNARVSIGLRLRVLQVLQEEGRMRLSQLLTTIRSSADPGPAVMALACADLIELDLSDIPIGPETIVGPRT